MSNLGDPRERSGDGLQAVRVGERAGSEHLGASLYELEPGEEMVFPYHGRRQERRFGARFDVADALGDYGGKAKLVPPAPGPRQTR